ncbi:DUF1465 family protein [Ancylobacter sp. G4_0304]|uniref:DUF1465 family protein n=1 Tax=Ancylobacter sp. G4_0304 TaxID=3114289 RepID=UPI0039C6F076
MAADRNTDPGGGAVNIAERRLASRAFAELFAEGMALVEEAAAYLDGTGRVESRDLSRTALTAYAQQSMRLSTRLMQLAAWLLLQRAVAEGDMRPQDARRESAKIDLEGPAPDEEQEELLPTTLRDLVRRGYELQRQIQRIDAGLARGANLHAVPERAGQERAGHSVASQIGRLRTAFER